MLSRKYYSVFARILGRAKTKEEIIKELIEFFKTDNSSFDERKFTEAIEKAQGK